MLRRLQAANRAWRAVGAGGFSLPRCAPLGVRFNSTEQAGTAREPREILAAALVKVPTHGWQDALTLAIREQGLSDQAASIFPNGKLDLVRFWLSTELEHLKKVKLTAKTVLGRVEQLTHARLLANAKLGHQLSPALSLLSTPKYLPLSLQSLSALSDEILYLAGDESTDLAWYSRRVALSGVVAASDKLMTTDTSKGHKTTLAFASKQLACLETAEEAEANVLEWLKFNAIASFNVAKSLTR